MNTRSSLPPRRVYTPGEVANLFRVDPKTVTRWARLGKFPPGAVFMTMGGHRRFYADQVEALLQRSNSGGAP